MENEAYKNINKKFKDKYLLIKTNNSEQKKKIESLEEEKMYYRKNYQKIKLKNEKDIKLLFNLKKFKNQFENDNNSSEFQILEIKKNNEIEKQNEIFFDLLIIKNAKIIKAQKIEKKNTLIIKDLEKNLNDFEKENKKVKNELLNLKKVKDRIKYKFDTMRLKYQKKIKELKKKIDFEKKDEFEKTNEINKDSNEKINFMRNSSSYNNYKVFNNNSKSSFNENSFFSKKNDSVHEILFGKNRTTFFVPEKKKTNIFPKNKTNFYKEQFLLKKK